MAASFRYKIIGIAVAVTLITITQCVAAYEFVEIEGKSFSLVSRIAAYTAGKRLTIGKFSEHYSTEQKRARIDYNFKVRSEIDRIGTWFVDSEKEIALELDRNALRCQSTSVKIIKDSINLSLEDSDETAGIDDYVVGPARVLLFIEKYRNRMQTSNSTLSIRNVQCVLYELVYSTPSGEKINFYNYYSEESLRTGDRAHPMRIIIITPKRTVLTLDFLQIKRFESQNSPPPLEKNGRTSTQGSNVNFDLFMFEPIIGCSEAIQVANQFDLFEHQSTDNTKVATKFSFEAHVDELDLQDFQRDNSAPRHSDGMRNFVAFHSGLSSMRVDTYGKETAAEREKDWQVNISNRDDWKKSKQIINFKMGKIYCINEGYSRKDRTREEAEQSGRCVITDLNELNFDQNNRKSLKEQMSVGNLLVGAEKFVYLGKAQVRGIAAKVYEAPDSSVSPYWLDQPVVYTNLTHQKELRYTGSGMRQQANDKKPRSSGLKRVVLVYLAEKDSNHPLLQVEIHTIDSVNLATLGRKTIQVYNFAWDLVDASDGDRALDLFLLVDSCTEYRGSSSHIEMLLESDELMVPIKEDNPIHFAGPRNIALLGNFQQRLQLPAPMIYDFESRIIKSAPSELLEKHFLKMTVSFNVAEHMRSKAELIFLGLGTRAGTMMTKLRQSFRACFYQSAHMHLIVEFGYDQNTGTCYIAFPLEATDNQDKKKSRNDAFVDERPKNFLLESQGELEIYRVQHSTDSNQQYQSYWVREMPVEETSYLGLNMRVNIAQNETMVFTIKRIQKELQNPQFNDTKDSGLINGDGILTGIGLLESSEGNERLQPAPMGAFNWSPLSHELSRGDGSLSRMSLAQCQASCLRDLECRSYSVCLKNSEIECVTSKTAFESEEILKQIDNKLGAAGQSTKRMSTITVGLANGKSVDLAKHPNCELHNKNYMSLFERRVLTSGHLKSKLAIPARSRVECAQVCFLHNIDVLKEDVNRISELFSSSFGSSSSRKVVGGKEIRDKLRQHNEAVSKICGDFYFLERQKLPRSTRLIEQFNEFVLYKGTNDRISDSNQSSGKDKPKREISGYCLFETKNANNTSQKEEIFREVFALERHSFKIDSLYEKQYGIHMKNSIMSKEQADAYRDFKWEGDKASEASYSILNSLVDRGHNFQQFIFGSPNQCARYCFMQSTELWPSCRSFDIVIIHGLLWCHLNSITLSQAMATSQGASMIINSNDSQVWHYEPRAGFIEKEAILSGNIELAEREETIHSRWIAKGGSEFRLHFFSLAVIIILGLFAGLVLGIRLGNRISTREERTQVHRVDVEGLVEPTSIGFANRGQREVDDNL